MKKSETHWKISEKMPSNVSEALNGYSQVFRQVLFNRGIDTKKKAEAYLNADYLPDRQAELLGLREAVARIKGAIDGDETIVVYGDYDADGVTSVALMIQTLQALNANARPYIPDRFSEGYGLNINALDMIKAQGASLVITVDCGIRGIQQAHHAKKIGLDLIITDHHTTGPELPEVEVLINPKQPGDPYPEKNLAGVGVAYKLAEALINELSPEGLLPEDLLDLVAIGTVSDLVPLMGENRALVRRGLRYMASPRRQGLVSLMGVSGLKPENITAMDIGFGLGPRVNAAGRIASALDAYNLLVTQDVFEAGKYAQILDNRNRERQRITTEIQEKVEELTHISSQDSLLLFAHDPDFNPGVVGLAAARLVEQYYRPTVVAFRGEEFTRASCRSIPEFHITEALEACSDLLVQFGGHAAAAGFTVKNEHLETLNERLTAIANARLGDKELQPSMEIDVEVPFSELVPGLVQEIAHMEPTGMGNASPLFATRGAQVRSARTVGRDDSHLKLTLTDGRITFDAIAFRQGYWNSHLPEHVDVAYAFEINEFNGRTTLQLNIKDIKEAE